MSTGNPGCQSKRSTASSTVSIAAASQPALRRSSISESASARCHTTVCSEPSAVFAIWVDGGDPVNPDRYKRDNPTASAVRKNAPTLYRLRTLWRSTSTIVAASWNLELGHHRSVVARAELTQDTTCRDGVGNR